MRQVSRRELDEMIGTTLGPSDWLRVEQERIDQFAEATGDHQFIHTDPERAAATPFGSTIAHGYLTLSLLPRLLAEVSVMPEGTVMGINYGLNSLRFLQPVPSGSAVRARAKLLEVSDKSPDRVLMTSEVTVEIEGQERPALVAETLTLLVVQQPHPGRTPDPETGEQA